MPATPATWLDAVTVNTTTAGTRADARVTVLSNGNILITWTATTQAPGEPAVSNIVGQILDPLGNPVNGEFIINVGSEGHLAGNSDIQATADGGFFAVFERNQAGLEDVLIIRFDASGTPSPSGNLFFDVTLSGANPSGFDPQVAVASETSGLAVWRETTETGESILRGFVFDASSPASAAFNDPNLFDLATDAGIQGEPAVVALANGSYAVAVSALIDGDSQILLFIVDQEGVVRRATEFSNGGPGVGDHSPSLSALPNGGFVMVWTSGDAVVSQRYQNNGNDLGQQTTLSGVAAGDDTSPSVHTLPDGTWLVTIIDAETGNLVVQRIDGLGDPVGDLAVVDAAGGDASAPGVALLPDGRMVVTFIGASGDVVMEILDTRDAPGEAGNTFTGTAGNDVIEYSGDAVFVGGGAGDDIITATAGPARTYDGGDGDDLLIAAAGVGPDTFIGGAGTDTLSYANASRRVYVDLLFNAADDGAEGDSFESIENLIGSAFDDILFGGNADNVIHGGDGNDALIGDGGDDILHGEAGDDQLFGGEGNDTLFGGEGDDRLEGGEGADILDGGDGFDIASYEEDDADLRVDLSTGASSDGDTLISIEGVLGGYGDDELIGDDGDNRLSGGDGDDLIRGGAGADILEGGDGIDTVSYAGSSAGVTINLSDNTASGGHAEGDVISGFENILGSSFDDVLTGDAGANVLDGGAGADRMEGGAGDDIYHVESRNDVVIELAGGGVDTVLSSVSFDARFTHVENITLLGGANANVVGNALSNIIIGNSADSIIIGNGGADYLTGGGGSDIFKYNEVSDSSFADYDRIMDLGADDFIDLRNIDANANVAGNQVFERVGEFTGQAGQLTLTWLPGAGFTLLAADVDGDGVADMRIVLYGNHEAFENILL
ncbi:calcium-binding protein [Brevundimonas abyssalis]|uniref:Alkaline phosphatase n=1 Tax=Brevundimonas abyssalis TAR-001 TaxID=1391729 RepID=A0A8E0NCT0_9CAUL|nr:calcium-binding protein [Brevundimonas abyssalis]GAD59975.1 alkaline phosphatase [Brevundimonas abyssalis TAR-001]